MPKGFHPLRAAYATSDAFERAFQIAQIARLGSLDAHDRVVDLLLELHERLGGAGLVVETSLDLPLTQETIAQALGLSVVHLNRTVQRLRSEQALTWNGKTVCLTDPRGRARQIGRSQTIVSAQPV
jgi:CRP-like cAMP-binding protein